MNNDSIFTKIIKGEIPSYKIYEDENTFVFLDVHPVTKGHTLVVPKKQIEFLWDLGNAEYQSVMDITKKVALHYRQILGVPYVGLKVVGTDVPHAHVHIIPFEQPHELHGHQDFDAPINHEELQKLQHKLVIK